MQGDCGADEQPSGPIKLTWRQGQPAPEGMALGLGAVVVHGNTAYFSRNHSVYSYTVPGNKWTKLPQCKYEHFAMAVINDALTTIGGRDCQGGATNTLLSLSGSSWEEVLPPMPTRRMHPAAANTPTHLVIAGGRLSLFQTPMATVVLNTETLQWFTASSLPQAVLLYPYPRMTTCGGYIYFAGSGKNVFSCSVKDLLESTKSSGSVWTRLARTMMLTNSSDGGSVWTRQASIPTPWGSSLTTLKECVLAIGGADDRFGSHPTGAIHCYDAATNSWSAIGEIPTPRSDVLTAVLPSNELVVVGGLVSSATATEIGICQ